MVSYRKRMMAFIMSFLFISGLLAGVAFYLINSLSSSMDYMRDELLHDYMHDEIILKINSLSELASKYSKTHGIHYEVQFKDELAELDEDMKKFVSESTHTLSVERVNSFYHDFRSATKIILLSAEEENRLLTEDELERFLLSAVRLDKSITQMHFDAMGQARLEAIRASGKRAAVPLYFFMFISFCLLSATFLLIFMRRTIDEPVDAIMKATQKVSSGDLGYRMDVNRQDEFGSIFEHFNVMIERLDNSQQSLEKRLNLSQLLLIIGSLSSEENALRDTLSKVSSLVSEILEKDIFAVFVKNHDTQAFEMSGCLDTEASMEGAMKFVEDSSLIKKLTDEAQPIILDSAFDVLARDMVRSDACLVVAPAFYDKEMVGFLVMGTDGVMDCMEDELDTLKVLASSLGAMIRNHMLHEETNQRLRQLSMVFELAKQITSLYDVGELLDTIAGGVAELIQSRGCVIRLKDGDKLIIRSLVGEGLEMPKNMTIPVGVGVSGRVAQTGVAMNVEDISSLSEESSIQTLGKKSALVAPMIKDGVIIGTLGVVDRLDEDGNITSFNKSDMDLVLGFASLSALAIDKAIMHEHGIAAAAEKALTERRMQMLFNNVQVGIVTLDRKYSIKSANTFVERWADMPSAHMIGRDARDVFHNENPDEGYICPHCAARVTFEEGGVYTVNMSKGLNYAELASYPFRDDQGNVSEAIVVIQDTTSRVLYEEDIMGLYREVMQANEYIESLIRNSADAIITTDIDGIVQTWNPAAEDVYGYRKADAIGKFLPYVPESGIDVEHKNLLRIRQGEVLNLEQFRRCQDGSMIEVSMTQSPIKDISGEIIGISHISRDITVKKRIENELVRRNQELSRLFFISSAMRGSLDLDKVLRMVLGAVTMGDGLGFNRAILFLADEGRNVLTSTMGVGPASEEEATRIWSDISFGGKGLKDVVEEIETGPDIEDSLLDRLGIKVEISLNANTALAVCAREKRPVIISGASGSVPIDPEIKASLGSEAYACVPLVSRGKLVGALWVDNHFNRQPITDEDAEFLMGFTAQMASAIESARLFSEVSRAEAELENIFSSISDMVYFTDKDFTIQNVNQSVLDRVGLAREEVVGQKCYRIFHGTDEPLPSCPHHKTVHTLDPYVYEVEDAHLGGTFITSTAPMLSPLGDFKGTVHVVRDISELKGLREKLQTAERMAALGEVAAKVAHEIRNPLVSIGGFAKRLQNQLEGPMEDYARIIATETGRMESILKDILGFVREVRMQPSKVDLNEIIESVLELLQTEFDKNNNKIIRKLGKGGVPVFVDPDRMREAIMNIVVNANQFMNGGTITVSTFTDGGRSSFTVEDTGPGIDKESLAHIYDPFYTTRTMGTGLGLAVTKRIIEEHNGSISVDDRPVGQGTLFRVYLPIEEGDYENPDS